jgi:hypothetical protein
MGHFSESYDENFDREDCNISLRKKMIQVILNVFTDKKYREVENLDDKSLRGLYAQACKKVKETEEEKRSF